MCHNCLRQWLEKKKWNLKTSFKKIPSAKWCHLFGGQCVKAFLCQHKLMHAIQVQSVWNGKHTQLKCRQMNADFCSIPERHNSIIRMSIIQNEKRMRKLIKCMIGFRFQMCTIREQSKEVNNALNSTNRNVKEECDIWQVDSIWIIMSKSESIIKNICFNNWQPLVLSVLSTTL